MDIIGIGRRNKRFFIAFAFLPNQSKEKYEWALKKIKGLFELIIPAINVFPSSISTDCDQALRNAISMVFPDSPALRRLPHANKNIQQHCRRKFSTTEAYNDFFQAWQHIVRSPSISEYHLRLRQFLATYSTPPEYQACARYIQTTWLRPG